MSDDYPKREHATEAPLVERLSAVVPAEQAGERFDQVLARLFPDYSRSRIQVWIRAGRATLDGREPGQREKVRGGERVTLDVVAEPVETWAPEPIALDIVHEDDDILVVDKPAGLVVHPGAGNPDGTLVNALLHHDARLAEVPRAGVVHRIDKETTGLLVVARTLAAHHALVGALERREIGREYEAVVVGPLVAGGTVDAPIGRHATQRTRMAVVASGRAALTRYRVSARYRAHTRVRVALETGRTHQIRVHMAHAGHPLLGDPVYGARLRVPPGAAPEVSQVLRRFRRQALHAARLALAHPRTGEPLAWDAPLPADLRALVTALESDARDHR